MKNIYLLFLLCFLSLSGYSQITTTIYANAATGTFTTGAATSTGTRTDNNILSNGTGTIRRGYAVFDLSSIPAGALITNVDLGIDIIAAGFTPGICSTNVYNGDLSLVTVGATLYANMAVPPSVNVSTDPYGSAIGNIVIPTSAAAEAAVGAGAGSKISYVFTNTGSSSYTIRGETGAAIISGAHCPYLTITYCPAPSAVTATASPTTLCSGDNLTLTGAATGATDYEWSGPGGYTSTLLNPSAFATTVASAGVYTLTAMATCGTFTATATATTATVVINPLPAAIIGASSLCVGSATNLTGDGTMPGNWTSSNPAVATIGLTTGTVIGISAGTVTMTYTVSTGCFVTFPMTINDSPGPISGPTVVCAGSNITLTNPVTGGSWTSSATGTATVGAGSGIVTGVSAGTVTITYTPGGCTFAVYDITVNPLPAPIVGPNNVCVGSLITETDADAGGTWSSSNVTVALVSSGGVVTGVSNGSVNIIYTFSSTTGCRFVKPIVVNPLPAAIVVPSAVCETGTITLTDATPGGNFSGGAPNATVSLAGLVSGITAGYSTVTYTLVATSCYVTAPLTVVVAPAPITGTTTLCENTTTTLSDSDPGGTWSSVSTANATVDASGVVTAILTPGTNILYTLPSGCSISVPLIINPAPVSVITPASATTFCAGDNVVLNATAGLGLTYQWYDGTTVISGETNNSYTASTSGAFSVEITNSFGCSTLSAPENVTAGINAVVNYTTPLNFCIGSNIVLTANTGGATGTIVYQWQKDGVDITGATLMNYSATSSGSYSCVVTISGGSGSCTVVSTVVNVLVNGLPTPSIAYSGTSLLTANVYSGYQWFLNTSAIPGATNFTYHPTVNGSYRVRVNDAIGCPGFSSAFPITGVGVSEVNKTQLLVYPNPAKDVVHIESSMAVNAVISGVEGKVVLSVDDAHDINISALSNGLYIIMLYDHQGERVMVQKLIKE